MNTFIGNNLNILLKKIKVHHGRIETIEFRPTRAISKKNMESKNPFEINGKKRKEEAKETEQGLGQRRRERKPKSKTIYTL